MRPSLPLLVLPLLLALAAAPPLAAADEVSPEKARDIQKLMELTGAAKLGTQMAGAMVGQMDRSLRTAFPNAPARVFDAVNKDLTTFLSEKINEPGGLTSMMIPIYHKHFSHDDVKGLIAFYESPLGRKVTAALPQITTDSMEAGQRWGEALAPEAQKRIMAVLDKEGYAPDSHKHDQEKKKPE